MRALVIARPGGPEVLEAREVEDPPAPGEGEVLLEVAAAGVNRVDTIQRMGLYPSPAGESPYPGVECSGTILALGPNVPSRWAVGDKVKRIDRLFLLLLLM
jgi:NADPH:quinone reductase-like Zn-dependent oxidoreductase